MKRILLILLTFILFSQIKMLADNCPTGYSPHSFTAEYQYFYEDEQGNITLFFCPIEVGYCCKWEPELKVVKAIFHYVIFLGPDGTCAEYLNDAEFNNWLYDQISLHANQNCKPYYTDCEDTLNIKDTTIVYSMSCYKYIRYQPYIGDDWVTKMIACDFTEFGCETKWQICWDYNISPPELKRKLLSKSVIQPAPYCPAEIPQLPPPGKSWNEPWETNCFQLDCQ